MPFSFPFVRRRRGSRVFHTARIRTRAVIAYVISTRVYANAHAVARFDVAGINPSLGNRRNLLSAAGNGVFKAGRYSRFRWPKAERITACTFVALFFKIRCNISEFTLNSFDSFERSTSDVFHVPMPFQTILFFSPSADPKRRAHYPPRLISLSITFLGSNLKGRRTRSIQLRSFRDAILSYTIISSYHAYYISPREIRTEIRYSLAKRRNGVGCARESL